MAFTFSPLQALSFSPQLTGFTSPHGCFSLLKLTPSGFYDEETALLWSTTTQQSKNVFILSKSSKKSNNFTVTGTFFFQPFSQTLYLHCYKKNFHIIMGF